MKSRIPNVEFRKNHQARNPKWLMRLGLLRFVVIGVWCFISHSTFVISNFAAEPDDPTAELASFQIADGFEANLFASEADGVVKPIQIRFDARGRLWVIGSTVYP